MSPQQADLAAELETIRSHVASGRDDLALERLDLLCGDLPGVADLHWTRSRCLFFLDHQAEALAALDVALELEPAQLHRCRELEAELRASGRTDDAQLIHQRLVGGELLAAQRWARSARATPAVAFALTFLGLVWFVGLLALVPAVAVSIVASEIMLSLGSARFRHLPPPDRIALGEVVASGAAWLELQRPHAVLLALLGLVTTATAHSMQASSTERGGAAAAGSLLVLGGVLAIWRISVRSRLKAEIESDGSVRHGRANGGTSRSAERVPNGPDEVELRTAVLPALLKERRHDEVLPLLDKISLEKLDEGTAEQLAALLIRRGEQAMETRAGRGDALSYFDLAATIRSDDPEVLLTVARAGRALRGPRPPAARAAMRRFPRWRALRVHVRAAAIAGGLAVASVLVLLDLPMLLLLPLFLLQGAVMVLIDERVS